ncbi:hydrolase [Zymomonas mobilis]|uniref:Peptidase M20 n=1 Tax=Zymomonas mobilis subsp. pomaceae (strain ATCC 29192 / DSM 22645 / JCM 10191 / CCUG 17912 / NBRC 13757 / NCIMB 11200 / NRRL B-4491 / Barker I) TaxID=579138 RepID=F8ERL6_ZYMMT|nr:hydrolase [Zymomonas mobilis]AEI37474.1 peptidase M20 [Zymomonas mobilis subsp. pomaceae ATCC 29192]MDX5948842.1 hydrolase [Zymomonas mobilis subsp. pomaceae]GEB88649.1 acetylornithine deacetylase [Zymomonas mobilis subsp. pomaceae]
MVDKISPCEQTVLEKAAAYPMLDRVIEWASINSGSHNKSGLVRMASVLKQAFSTLPGKITEITLPSGKMITPEGDEILSPDATHLHLVVRPNAPIQILLTGHMDTVFGENHPFSVVTPLEGNRLGGPGVADMKGGLAVMLSALTAFEHYPDHEQLGYEVILNSDEEIGSLSSAPLLVKAAEGKTAAFTYEPSALPDGTFAAARPGSGNFSIIIKGLAAHAGRNLTGGRNALIAAADFALRLKAASREGMGINPAKIDGGGPNNIVPDHAILRVNIRPSTLKDMEEAQQLLQKTTEDIEKKHDVTLKIHGAFGRPPKNISEKSKALMALVENSCQDLGLGARWKDTGGVCDGNNIAAANIPVIDTMGVRGGAIHSDQEFLIIESLKERAQLSALIWIRLLKEGGL